MSNKNFTADKLTFSPMKGTIGHCIKAQIWDEDGFNLASIDSRYGAKRATQYAQLFASAPNMYNDLKSLVLSITSHPDYVNGSESDEWHDLVNIAEETLKRAVS